MARETFIQKAFPLIACPAITGAVGMAAYTVNKEVAQGHFTLMPYALLAAALAAVFALYHTTHREKPHAHLRPLTIETLSADF